MFQSRNRINILPPDVGNLEKLRHLNAQQTNISTLPPEIALCQELEELMLWGNSLESLPETLKEMPKLTLLALNYRSFASVIDDYMKNLLQKGQIQSEHIPPVVFQIPALNILDLEETKLNMLPDSLNSRLTELCLARNFFREIPTAVTKLKLLRLLDLSDNLVTNVSDDLRKLRALKTLNLRGNTISALPKAVTQLRHLVELNLGGNSLVSLPADMGDLKKLKTLILDKNQLQSLPDSIADLDELETLDLTNNRLRQLPTCMYRMKKIVSAHTFCKLHRYGLWLHKNPLVVPPPQVWQTEDVKMIYDYLRKYEIRQTKNLQRLKIVVLGAKQSGKTSLVRSMVNHYSSLTTAMVDSTPLIEFTKWKTENYVDVVFLDLGADDVYQQIVHIYMHYRALYLIIYDHSTYISEKFEDVIGYWLRMIFAYAPGAVVKLVGTHSDGIEETAASMTREILTSDLNAFVVKCTEQLQIFQAKLDKTVHLANRNVYKSANDNNKMTLPVILQTVALVSSAEGIAGVHELMEEIEKMAVNKNLFPHLQRPISLEWLTLRKAIKNSKGFVVTKNELKQMAKQTNVELTQLEDLISYLNDNGDVMYFGQNPELNKVIFHRPCLLAKALCSLFNHNPYPSLDFQQNHIWMSEGNLTENKFQIAKDNYLSRGLFSNQFLRSVWFHLQLDNKQFEQLKELVASLRLGYRIAEPPNLSFNEKFLPSLRTLTISELYPNVNKRSEIDLSNLKVQMKVEVLFPLCEPPGLFQCSVFSWQSIIAEFNVSKDNIIVTTKDGYNIQFSKDNNYNKTKWTIEAYVNSLSEAETCQKIIVKQLVECFESYPGLVYCICS